MKLDRYRKGITPVIAIVLLLMVTVGAVGVVYTQFQSLVGDPTEDIDQQQRNQDTDISILRGKSNDTSNYQNGQIVLEIQNTGSVTRNTSSFRMTTQKAVNEPGADGALCTTNANSSLVDPDDTHDCHTGVDFPQATNEVVFNIDLEGSDKSWEYVCRPETTDTAYC